MTLLLGYCRSAVRAAARPTLRLRIADSTGKKEVGYFSAMPADGMSQLARGNFGTSRSKRQLLKDYAISRALERYFGDSPRRRARRP